MAARSVQHVAMIPVDRITVLNPRVRNRRVFREIIENIARIGLKRPITVSPRRGEDGGVRYDLVCGQGRLEAFIALGQTEIPAIVVEAAEADCLIMSLIENLARRQHLAIELLREIGGLRKRGYTDHQIARKIGVTPEYVSAIAGLLEKGEERLVAAVETGLMPLSLATEIARADDEGVQRALTQAYTERKLRGKKLIAVRRLIEQRQRRGKGVPLNLFGPRGRPRRLSAETVVRIYRQEAERQRVLVKKAELAQSRLMFVVAALRVLQADENFMTLLRAEGLDTMPAYLAEQLNVRTAP